MHPWRLREHERPGGHCRPRTQRRRPTPGTRLCWRYWRRRSLVDPAVLWGGRAQRPPTQASCGVVHVRDNSHVRARRPRAREDAGHFKRPESLYLSSCRVQNCSGGGTRLAENRLMTNAVRGFLHMLCLPCVTVYRIRNRISAAVTFVRLTPPLLFAAACGSVSTPASPTPPPAGSPPASGPPTVTITATGVSPREVSVAVGGTVTFVNRDIIPHDVAGGPDPATPDCREIDAVGFLAPGQIRQTAPLPTARICEYHDHGYHSPLFNGRIIIR